MEKMRMHNFRSTFAFNWAFDSYKQRQHNTYRSETNHGRRFGSNCLSTLSKTQGVKIETRFWTWKDANGPACRHNSTRSQFICVSNCCGRPSLPTGHQSYDYHKKRWKCTWVWGVHRVLPTIDASETKDTVKMQAFPIIIGQSHNFVYGKDFGKFLI